MRVPLINLSFLVEIGSPWRLMRIFGMERGIVASHHSRRTPLHPRGLDRGGAHVLEIDLVGVRGCRVHPR
jgi:hypothetical protein